MAKEKEKQQKAEPTTKKNRKKLIIKSVLIFLLISLIVFMTYRYTEEAKEASYVKGGQNAIEIITGAVTNSGGISITNGNNTMILSKYDKSTTEEIVIEETATEETATEETTNQTEE